MNSTESNVYKIKGPCGLLEDRKDTVWVTLS